MSRPRSCRWSTRACSSGGPSATAPSCTSRGERRAHEWSRGPMNTALRAASLTLRELLPQQLSADGNLRPFFDTGAGGALVVSLLTPQEMADANGQEGLSVWLYR